MHIFLGKDDSRSTEESPQRKTSNPDNFIQLCYQFQEKIRHNYALAKGKLLVIEANIGNIYLITQNSNT